MTRWFVRGLDRALSERRLVRESTDSDSTAAAIYRPRAFHAEVEIAKSVDAITQETVDDSEPEDLQRRIDQLASLRDLELSRNQRAALLRAMTESFLVITGGPGTGKTTLIRAVVEDAHNQDKRVLLAAPTGRAAKRLAAASHTDARTLHRLLEFDPRTMTFQRNREHPLEADSIIVDESSMLDTSLAYHLLQAVPSGCQVILVGDVDQLPPIGPGKVLSDLIDSGVVPVVRLVDIYRQAESGLIVENAHRIRRGQSLRLELDRPVDFYSIDRSDPEELLTTLDHLVGVRIPRRFGFDPKRDLQVLTPMRRGLVGTENLNHRLQDLINSDGRSLEMTDGRLRAGDRVMQIRNNYELDVFNGDIGIVVGESSDGENLSVRFDGRNVDYRSADLDELVLAYACSIHKSQGSEFPCVILVLHSQHYVMLQRNLLYTGVTRGERLVIVLGDRKAVSVALSNDRPTLRFTRLRERLRGSI